jgi:hypothetical protein
MKPACGVWPPVTIGSRQVKLMEAPSAFVAATAAEDWLGDAVA